MVKMGMGKKNSINIAGIKIKLKVSAIIIMMTLE
jgi:hypothetical protein